MSMRFRTGSWRRRLSSPGWRLACSTRSRCAAASHSRLCSAAAVNSIRAEPAVRRSLPPPVLHRWWRPVLLLPMFLLLVLIRLLLVLQAGGEGGLPLAALQEAVKKRPRRPPMTRAMIMMIMCPPLFGFQKSRGVLSGWGERAAAADATDFASWDPLPAAGRGHRVRMCQHSNTQLLTPPAPSSPVGTPTTVEGRGQTDHTGRWEGATRCPRTPRSSWCRCGTEEMMQPCLIDLHLISLVATGCLQESKHYYGDYLRYQMGRQFYHQMGNLPDVMKSGVAPSYASWFSDPETAATYTQAQHNGKDHPPMGDAMTICRTATHTHTHTHTHTL